MHGVGYDGLCRNVSHQHHEIGHGLPGQRCALLLRACPPHLVQHLRGKAGLVGEGGREGEKKQERRGKEEEREQRIVSDGGN